MIWIFIASWLFLNLILTVFIFHELTLAFFAAFGKKNRFPAAVPALDNYPKVCVQLPVYNEKFVAERLIDQVALLKYPSDKLVIQILDDSTDETTEIIDQKLKRDNLQNRFQHVRRSTREGFKAGALKHGMTLTDAEYFAIFDADFLPDPDFLNQTMPWFKYSEIGVVQTRWTHLNEDYSILTRAESVMLDAHFGIEQEGRTKAGGFINFNGTAGVWRRSCIDDAGGWQGDTLTEDLDLSFRAQIKNWKIHFLFRVESPAELPVTYHAYRHQQYRWSKGAAECFRKNRKLLWRSRIGLKEKVIGTFHLLNSSVYMLVLGLMLLAPFVEYLIRTAEQQQYNLAWIPYLGMFNNFLLLIILFIGKIKCSKNSIGALLWFFPSILMFFLMSLAIAPYMALAVFNGYRGKKSEFVRTPKFGFDVNPSKIREHYNQRTGFNLVLIEFLFFCLGIFWVVMGLIDFNPFTLTYGLLIGAAFFIAVFLRNSELKFR